MAHLGRGLWPGPSRLRSNLRQVKQSITFCRVMFAWKYGLVGDPSPQKSTQTTQQQHTHTHTETHIGHLALFEVSFSWIVMLFAHEIEVLISALTSERLKI